MKYSLDADLSFDKNSRGLSRHTGLRPGTVWNIHTVDSCVLKQANGVERFLRITAFRRKDFD